ncbi:hypothetical protein BGZ61DRAFT_495137 [Ilyonectria robusta]|uniref:uncharacterized protein n=1 Tax=Ilyonectria robusta TaxID=1079257 RepID=UPI001E8EEDC6|nr:uncharacterized protein BGZ61DRAFT_495137 [Ilyonectria robusta]KAH8686469.1 hypothetical protein BGZ61DRAFT_495137 [Ilyonectria robusta]
MLVLSEIAQLSLGPAILGVVISLGAFSVIVHTLLHNRKALSRISQLAATPTPEKSKKSIEAEYVKVFPPSQRTTLQEVNPKLWPAPKAFDLSVAPQSSILKLDEDYRLAKPSSYVFSGFSVGDIRGLGNFPNYAAISGVPLPSPVKNFNIQNALARPYRPFRWAYHQTMSYKKMDPDFWIELENTYVERIRQRQEIYAKHGKDVLDWLPGSELACKELMEMVLQFICARYPNQFELIGNTFVNHILNTKQDLSAIDPLLVLLNNVPEDFAMTLRDPETGRYVLRAGVVCSSVGWNIGEKMGLGLPAIHRTVPDYKEKMEFSMDRFFTKMPTSSPIQRGSWGLEIGQPLYLPSDHPDFSHRETQNPSLKPEDLHLRVDWQTLRRLPLSGAIVFNFKALFTPITEFQDEPYIPSIVLKVLNEGKENLMKYKGTWHVEHVAKPTMEKYEKQQIEQGLIEKDWKVQTLDESPYFKDWERKWRLE